MKADEKARQLADEIGLTGLQYNRAVRSIALALKEQDRDTRHACAEAVIHLPGCHSSNENAIYDHRGEICKAVDVHAAHAACMNAKAI